MTCRITISAVDWARWLDTMAAEVRSGSSLTVAYGAAAQRHTFRGTVVGTVDHPGELGRHSTDDPDEAVVVQAITLAADLGGPIAATLDSAAAVLRERAAALAEAHAHSAQARLSARVLTAVPLGFATWSAATSGSFRAAVASPAGAATVAAGALLNLAGWAWMRHVIGRAVR